jgi:hypothetical protein
VNREGPGFPGPHDPADQHIFAEQQDTDWPAVFGQADFHGPGDGRDPPARPQGRFGMRIFFDNPQDEPVGPFGVREYPDTAWPQAEP